MSKRLVVGGLERLADHRVAAPVAFLDHAGELGIGRLAAMGRMIGLAESPEHVLDPVGRVEEAIEQALVERLQLEEVIIASRSRQAVAH